MDPGGNPQIRFVVIGGVVALAAGAAIAWSLVAGHQGERQPPPPASKAGLIIDESRQPRLNPAKSLRCFVSGQFVGEFTIAECARRNGVATDQLDVGVDRTGALAASQVASAEVTPLPPAAEKAPSAATVQAAAGPPAACWRYGDGGWRRLSDMGLSACVQTLFAGRCEKPGGALYGRWAQQTLRLVPGKVEVSTDNRNFRTLAEQSTACVVGAVG